MKNIKLILALLVSLAVTACGGGGGDGGLGNSVPTTPLLITSDATQLQKITTAALNTTSGSAINIFSPSDFLDALNAINPSCANGGTVEHFASGSASGTIDFFDCSYTVGKSLRGTVSYSFLTTTPLNNFFNPDDLSAKLNFNLTVTRTGFPITTLVGDYNLGVTGLNSSTTTKTSSSSAGASLKVSNNLTEVISNFSFQNVSLFSSSESGNNYFTLASSYLGGVINYDTITPFVTNTTLSHRFPSTGSALITSTASSSELLVTIMGDEYSPSPNQIKIEFRTSPSSIYNPPVFYAWTYLFPPP
jgi:hypothetical protein